MAAPAPQGDGRRVLRRRRLPPADHRRRARPGPSRSASRSSSATRDATSTRRACFGVLLQYPGSVGRGPRPRRRRRRAPTTPARWSPSPPTCSRCALLAPAGRAGRRRRASARRSASACRSASAARTPGSSPRATRTSARCPAAWSACRSTPPAAPPTASPCRPASSTSAARRPRRNICTAQVLLAVIAVDVRRVPRPRRARAASPQRVHRLTAILAAGLRAAGHRGRPRRVLRHAHRAGARSAPTRSLAAALERRHQPAPRRRRHASASRSTRPRRRDVVEPCWPRSASTASVDDARRRRRRRHPRRRCARTTRVPHPPGRSTATAPRPRCCATCAASPTRTSRSTAR